jgi:hypothetical protein
LSRDELILKLQEAPPDLPVKILAPYLRPEEHEFYHAVKNVYILKDQIVLTAVEIARDLAGFQF